MARGLFGPKKMARGSGARPPEPPAIINRSSRIASFARSYHSYWSALHCKRTVRSALTRTPRLSYPWGAAAHGGGFLDDGQKTVFPPGYPELLAILLALDLACPWVIVDLNLIFLAVGLGAICGALLEYNSMYFSFKSLCVSWP